MTQSNKLTKEQADLIVNKSLAEIAISGNRLGCTITKHLTLKITSNIIDPSKDIFFIKDDELAKEMFYLYCVNTA